MLHVAEPLHVSGKPVCYDEFVTLNRISWALYIIGFGVVAASWINLVNPAIGWVGWVIGMVGWGLGFMARRQDPGIAQELERLAKLRQDGTITPSEFEEAKLRLLS